LRARPRLAKVPAAKPGTYGMAAHRVIRAAVVGAGNFGARHAEKYAALPEAELVAVVDRDPARAAEIAGKHGALALTDPADLPDDVEAVSVAAPTVAHHPVGMALLRRGVHILIEKPIAERIELGEELAAEAEARGLVLQVGHIERHSPVFEALAAAVTLPLFIESNRISPFTGRSTDVNVVLDLMIHDIDLIASLVGRRIEGIEAVGAPVLTDREDIANARLRFDGGCVANITASRISMKTERRMRVFQPEGYVAADLVTRKLTRIGRSGAGFDAAEDEFPPGDNLKAEIASFLRAVAEGGAPKVTGRDGVEALRTALAIADSLGAHRARVERMLADRAAGAAR
jgi:predicted dehydrogenase